MQRLIQSTQRLIVPFEFRQRLCLGDVKVFLSWLETNRLLVGEEVCWLLGISDPRNVR